MICTTIITMCRWDSSQKSLLISSVMVLIGMAVTVEVKEEVVKQVSQAYPKLLNNFCLGVVDIIICFA